MNRYFVQLDLEHIKEIYKNAKMSSKKIVKYKKSTETKIKKLLQK